MKRIFIGCLFTILLCTVSVVRAQEDVAMPIKSEEKGVVTVAANPQYNKARKFKRLMLGDHYRKEWAEPVQVEILNLDREGGGLTPLRVGGGLQTKSLRLKGGDGKEYVLRSVNKDPSKALPPEFVGTFAADVVQDQISSSHPYAPLAVAKLAESAHIFHTNPKMVWVPHSSRLGEFNSEFANTLCLFEERPSGSGEANSKFGNAYAIVNSERLFQKLRADNDNLVDERAFVKARLFDMWIGDWDRHEDQWVWAAFKEDDNTVYRPIPRDRDQAFARLDGFIPQLAARKWAVRKTKSFESELTDVNGLNINGAFLDRSFTTRLLLKDWLEMAAELQQSLTDEKIEIAFNDWPVNIFAISGKKLIARLKERRSELKDYATTYYNFLSQEVNIVGTDKNEFFEVVRKPEGYTQVIVNKLNKKGNKSDLLYQRTFSPKETKEIRLYGLGGTDQFFLDGKVKKGITVRVIGGDGHDSVADNSSVKGWNHKTKVYDTEIAKGNSTEAYYHLSHDSLKNGYDRRSFRYDWLAPKVTPGYNPDDGIYIGGGVIFKKQQFGLVPFGYMQSIWVNYAFATGAYNFGYEGVFREAVGRWDLNINMNINAPNYVINYFGMGNETALTTEDRNYNRVRSNQWNISSSLSRQLSKYHFVNAGLGYQSVKVEHHNDRFVNSPTSKLDSTDFQKNYFGQAQAGYQFNTTDNPLYPQKGIRISSTIRFSQNLQKSDENFTNFGGDAAFYFTLKPVTVALRTGAATNFGNTYEFYQGNTLGGSSNLRGFRRDRFSGKTNWYQNTELRLKFSHLDGYFLRGNYGLLTFFDVGRVWIPNESSDRLHYGYGGGLWFLPYNRIAFTATYSQSKEDQFITIKAGFLF